MSLEDVRRALLRAAEKIEAHARELRRSHTLGPDHNDWSGESHAFAAWIDDMEAALHCRQAASELSASLSFPPREPAPAGSSRECGDDVAPGESRGPLS